LHHGLIENLSVSLSTDQFQRMYTPLWWTQSKYGYYSWTYQFNCYYTVTRGGD